MTQGLLAGETGEDRTDSAAAAFAEQKSPPPLLPRWREGHAL